MSVAALVAAVVSVVAVGRRPRFFPEECLFLIFFCHYSLMTKDIVISFLYCISIVTLFLEHPLLTTAWLQQENGVVVVDALYGIGRAQHQWMLLFVVGYVVVGLTLMVLPLFALYYSASLDRHDGFCCFCCHQPWASSLEKQDLP